MCCSCTWHQNNRNGNVTYVVWFVSWLRTCDLWLLCCFIPYLCFCDALSQECTCLSVADSAYAALMVHKVTHMNGLPCTFSIFFTFTQMEKCSCFQIAAAHLPTKPHIPVPSKQGSMTFQLIRQGPMLMECGNFFLTMSPFLLISLVINACILAVLTLCVLTGMKFILCHWELFSLNFARFKTVANIFLW